MPSRGIEVAAPTRLRLQLLVGAGLLLISGLSLLGRDLDLGESIVVLPICAALVVVFNAVTVTFMLAQFRTGGDSRLLVIAAAFAWSAVLAIGTLLVLPGVTTGPGATPESLESIALLFLARHLGLPLLVALALSDRPLHFGPVQPRRTLAPAVAVVGGVIAAGAAFVAVVVVHPAWLPDIVRDDGSGAAVLPAVIGAALVGNLVLLAVALRGAVRRRLHRRLESWVLLTLVADTCDMLLTVGGGEPWSAAWYGGRLLGVSGAVLVVAALLYEAHRLQSRTQAIAEQLVEQNASLTEAQGLRDHLVAVVSHDMRSPLAGLLGYLELLEGDPDLDEAQVQRMHARSRLLTRRLIMLTEDLLASATREGLHVIPEDLDLARQVDECVAAFPELSVIVVCPPGLEVHADPLRLQQILTNLVRNAQKHGAEPVRIRAARLGSRRVQVTVTDAGAGVPEEFVPLMFERYTRGPGRATHGSGLGLSVARSLAERHDGALDYDVATRAFRLVLPAARQRSNAGFSFARKALTPSAKSGPV